MTDYSRFMTVKSPSEIILEHDNLHEELSLSYAPIATSALVQSARKDILQTINLGELFKNLSTCVSLLNITYNAVNCTGLSSTITGLKDKFSDTIKESITVMTGFNVGTETAVLDFIQIYKFLSDPKYTKCKPESNGIVQACHLLKKIQNKAVMMQNDAASLAKTFEGIEKTAQEITKKIMNERELDYKKKEEMESKLKLMQGQVDALKKVKENLDDEVAEYAQNYDKISKQIEKNEKQAFGLQLSSTIIGGITAIAGPLITAFSPTAAAAGVANNLVSSGKSEQQQQQQTSGINAVPQSAEDKIAANKNLEESQKNIKDYEERIVQIDNELAKIKTQIETETDKDKQKTLSDQQDSLEKEKKEKSEKLKTAQGQAEVYKGVQKGITDGMQYTSQKMGTMSQNIENKTDALYDNLNNIAKQKVALSKERRGTIQQLAEMTSQIANATTETRDFTMVFNALVMAVGCMRIVKVYLSDIELFWKNVAKFCARLVEGVVNIHDNVNFLTDVKDYTEFFTDKNFVILYLINISNWVALNSISEEYLNAFNDTYNAYRNEELNNEENIDPKVHWQRAKTVAKNLEGQLQIELKTKEA